MSENIYKPGANSNITIKWNVKPVDATEEQEAILKESVAQKYGVSPSNITIIRQYIRSNAQSDNDALTYETIQNIQDPKFQQALFFDYLKDNDITDYDQDLLLGIDGQVNAQINYDAYDKAKHYDIKYIKWDNFLSYGPGNYFDFTKLKGLVLLNGMPANQSGKSTFSYDLIHFALHGKTSSGKVEVLNDYFNKYTPEATEVFVEICLTIDGCDYIIRRKLTRPELGKKNRKVTQSVEYFRLEEGVEIALEEEGENLKSGTTQQTNKVIKEAIGNEKDFDLVICANSSNLTSLISLGDTERGRLLSRWIGLLPLEEKDKIAREMWNNRINVGLKSSVYNKEEIRKEIEDIKKDNEDFNSQIESKNKIIENANNNLAELDKKREDLLLSMKKVDESLPNIDIQTLTSKIDSIIAKGKAKKAEIEQVTNRLAEIGEVDYSDADYKALVARQIESNTNISNIKNEIGNLRILNRNLAAGEYCPTCKRKLDNVDNSGLIKENNDKIDQLIQSGIQNKAILDETIAAIANMEANRNLKIEKDRLELKLGACNTERELLGKEYKENITLKENIERSIKDIEFNNSVSAEINIVKESVRTFDNTVRTISSEVAFLVNAISTNEGIIREKEALIATIEEEEHLIKNWKIYLTLIGKNGISKMVLRKSLPIINEHLNQLLDGVCDFTVEVGIDDTNNVTFTLVRNGIRSSLASGSGYEQTVTALALRVVLGHMSTLSKPPFILLDEVLGGVAQENYDNIKKLYDRITGMYRFVFQITHLGEPIIGWHDMVVTVKKDANGISSIVQE